MTHNPFDVIEGKLDRIESLLTGLNTQKERPAIINEVADFIPVQQIFGKYCSKATFYSHVKAGRVKLHKFGNRSFVNRDEFLACFKKVNIAGTNDLLTTNKDFTPNPLQAKNKRR